MGHGGTVDGVNAAPERRWGRFALRIVASLAVLGVVLAFIDTDRALAAFRQLRPWTWCVALGAFLFLHVLSALKWRYLLALAGARIDARTALACHGAGLFGNLCLPSLIGGDLLRAGLALRATPARTAVVVGSLADRVADLTALVAVAAAATAAVGTGSGSSPRALPIAAVVLAVGAVGPVLTLHVLVRTRLVRRLPRKVARRVLEVAGAVRTMRRTPWRAAAAWCACVAIQSGFVLVNIWLGRALGMDLTTGQWFLVWPLAKIAAMLPVSFGGLGVREAAFASLVGPFSRHSQDLAVAQSLVWQSVLIVGGLVAGAWSALTSPRPAAAAADTA